MRIVILVMILLVASLVYAQGAEDSLNDQFEPPQVKEMIAQSIESGVPFQGTIKSTTPINIQGAEIQASSGAKASGTKEGVISISKASEIKSQGVTATSAKDVKVTKSGKVSFGEASKVDLPSSSQSASFAGVKDASIDSSGNAVVGSAESATIAQSKLGGIKGLSSSGDTFKIQSLDSIYSDNLKGTSLRGVTMTPSSFSATSGKLVDFFRSLASDVSFFQGSIPSQRFLIKQSSSVSAGPILLENLKDAEVKVGSQLVVESNDSFDLIAGPQKYHLTPINASQRISGSTDQSPNPKIRVESANITFDAEEATETAIIPQSAIITTDQGAGITCLDLDSSSSYLYQTPRIQSSFQLQNPNQHTLCIKRKLGQQVRDCAECSTLDLTTDELRSSGTLQYQRFYFTQEVVSNVFVPFVLPNVPSRYEVSWDKDVYKLKSTSEDAILRINSMVSLYDKRESGKSRRYVLFENATSVPLPSSIRSEFPEVTIKDHLLIQPTIQGTRIRVNLN